MQLGMLHIDTLEHYLLICTSLKAVFFPPCIAADVQVTWSVVLLTVRKHVTPSRGLACHRRYNVAS